MADDLKPALTKVLASAGKKKFFFAYGAGKRKDGKGDGELAVAGKKLKKAEVEGELADCKEVLEGVCWASPDGETVFFQGRGKKLSPMIVAKMALTAKRTAGKQYDFRVPSAEEEARADKVAEGDEGEAPPAPPPAPPPPHPTRPADDRLARLKALLLRQKSLAATAPAAAAKLAELAREAAAAVQAGSDDAPNLMDRLEQAINAERPDDSRPGRPVTPGAPAGTDEPARGTGPLVKFRQARLLWDAARARLRTDLAALRAAILERARTHPRAADIARTVAQFDDLESSFGSALSDKLDEAMNAGPGADRERCTREAAALVRRHLAEVRAHPLLPLLDGNPLVPVDLTKNLTGPLEHMAKMMGV